MSTWFNALAAGAVSSELRQRQLVGARFLTDPESFHRLPPPEALLTSFLRLGAASDVDKLKALVASFSIPTQNPIKSRVTVWNDIVNEVRKRCPKDSDVINRHIAKTASGCSCQIL